MRGREGIAVSLSGRGSHGHRDAGGAGASGGVFGVHAGVRAAAADATTVDERRAGAGAGRPWVEAASGDFAGGGGDAEGAVRRLAHARGKYLERVHGAGYGGPGLRFADLWFSHCDPRDAGRSAGEQSRCTAGAEYWAGVAGERLWHDTERDEYRLAGD